MDRRALWNVAVLSLTLVGCAGEAEKSSESVGDASPPDEIAHPFVESPRTAEAPLAATRRDDGTGYATIRVFYGTNREATGKQQPSEFFGTERGPLSFGYCDVSIPPNHQEGVLESPKLWKFEFRENPEKHVVLLSVTPTSGPEFITALQRAVWDSIEWRNGRIRGGEALVFIHGFNNSFEDAARRTAQIAEDLKFRGAPIMYSWPSQQSASLRGYQDDARAIGWCEEHFLNFMAGVARESGARRVHVIAHSMGNRLLAETLRKLSYHFRSGELPRLSQVILTAPDIDAEYFQTAIAPRIVQTADRVTIYSSSRDLALKASSVVNRIGRKRLGEAGDELSTFPDYRSIEMVDASTVDTGLFSLNHSYHADDPTVLDDIAMVLDGLAPGERGLKALMGALAWRIRGAHSSIRQAVHTIVR